MSDEYQPTRMYDPAKLRAGELEILPVSKSEAEKQIEKTRALQTEDQIVEQMRNNAADSSEILGGLLTRVSTVDDKELAPTLRAVADVQAKSLDGLLKLTGRAPEQDGSVTQLLRSLAADGLIKLNVNLDVSTT